MTKAEIEKEAQSLKDKLTVIEERAKMELATSKFLCHQADELMAKWNLPETSHEKQIQIAKEIEALHARMILEANLINSDNAETEKIHQRVVELYNMWRLRRSES